MNENIRKSAEERPQLGLDYRGLWCAVIENAIEDAKGRKLSAHGTKPYRLRADAVVKRDARKFLESDDLDLICDLFLDGIHADTIRRGLKENLKLTTPELLETFEPLTKFEIIEALTEN